MRKFKSAKFVVLAAMMFAVIGGAGAFTAYKWGGELEDRDKYKLPFVGKVTTFRAAAEPAPGSEPLSPFWNVRYHGTCCEGNMAAAGDSAYVLLPELVDGNDILKSSDGGLTWGKQYPPVDVSEPYGIEGDLQAIGNDVIFFGTLLHSGVVSKSVDKGATWTTLPIPVAFPANDQAWSYLGPFNSPACVQGQTAPYVLAGWYRIGSVVLFSCDGGLTWPVQTPLVADADPLHVVCINNSHGPSDQGDRRIPNAGFANMKSGRFGAWGTDKQFYWTDTDEGSIYVCKTNDFGVSWTGVKHPIAPGPVADGFVSHAAFDDKGTLYVMHGDKIYVSFDQGESFKFTHVMPKYANVPGDAERGSDQFFVVKNGTVYLAVAETLDGGDVNIWYLKAEGADTATPAWTSELVDRTGPVRRDFVQIALDGVGNTYISYTTPGGEVTTATRKNSPPVARLYGSPVSGKAPLNVNLDGSASFDVDSGAIASYTFDFADGSPAVTQPTPTITHTFTRAGVYRVRLVVTDQRGLASSPTEFLVQVDNPSVSGRVVTSSGSGISGATITITNNATGAALTATSDLLGNFTFNSVPTGSYRAAVRAQRYKFDPQQVTVEADVSGLVFTANR